MSVRKINRVCLCKWPYLFQHPEEGPNVLHWRKSVHTHTGAGPALRGWHKPRRCFAGWQLGVLRAAAVLNTGFWELCIAGCAEMGRVVIQSWQEGRSALAPPTLRRAPAVGRAHSPLALSRPPWATDSKLWFVTSAAEWLVHQSWHYFFLILYLLSSEYFGWVIIQCVLCIAEPRNICFGFSSWLVRVCGFWPRSHGIVSDYVNEIFIQENNEYRPENKAHPVAISQRQFFLLKPIRGSAVVIIYTCP